MGVGAVSGCPELHRAWSGSQELPVSAHPPDRLSSLALRSGMKQRAVKLGILVLTPTVLSYLTDPLGAHCVPALGLEPQGSCPLKTGVLSMLPLY